MNLLELFVFVLNQHIVETLHNSDIFFECSQHLNTHEIQQLVDAGFVSLDVNPKDNLLEYDELVTLFNQKDVDGKSIKLFR